MRKGENKHGRNKIKEVPIIFMFTRGGLSVNAVVFKFCFADIKRFDNRQNSKGPSIYKVTCASAFQERKIYTSSSFSLK